MKKVYVEDDDHLIKRMCRDALGWVHSTPAKADVFVFSGGADVSPELYGEKNVASGCNKVRDTSCQSFFDYARQHTIPMVGICRGAQFLNVANGGKMWQDVDRHAIGGTHEATDDDGTVYLVTSTHHQMMRPSDDARTVTTARRSTRKQNDKRVVLPGDNEFGNDFEVLWYEDTRSLCYQPHPEYGVKSCLDHFVKLLERFDLR